MTKFSIKRDDPDRKKTTQTVKHKGKAKEKTEFQHNELELQKDIMKQICREPDVCIAGIAG